MVTPSMFGDAAPDEPAKKAKKRKAPETDGAVKRMMDRFYDRYVARWNPAAAPDTPKRLLVTPVLNGKHAAKFKQLLASWDEAVVGETVDDYFTTTIPEVTRGDYSADKYFLVAQLLRLNRVRRAMDEAKHPRTEANMREAAKAMGKKEL